MPGNTSVLIYLEYYRSDHAKKMSLLFAYPLVLGACETPSEPVFQV